MSTLLIKNAKLLTMEGPGYECANMLISNGKITAISPAIPDTCAEEVFDAKGMTAMPGMIDAHCHVGIYNYDLGVEGGGSNEMTRPMTPHLFAIDGINPRNSIMRDSYEAGITTICTGPGSANLLGGMFCVMKTYGDRVDDMIIKREAALKAAFGENPKRCYGRMMSKQPATRMGSVALLRQRFYDATDYMNAKIQAQNGSGTMPDVDLELEAIEKVLEKKIPLKCHAHRADDIFSAIRFAKEFDINITLEHCTDGKAIAKELKKEGYPLVVGPIFCERYKVEMMGLSYDTPAFLSKEGIKFAFCTDAPVVPQRLLPVATGYAVSQGLDPEEALRAITIYPAEILGVADRVGSLKEGKDADVVLYDGHPFDLEARVKLVLIDGRPIYRHN